MSGIFCSLKYKKSGSNAVIVTEKNYYPFGLKHKGYNTGSSSHLAEKKGFISVELQEENNINWYDVTARNYDPALGRWMNIDPLSEDYLMYSPYNYTLNNPIIFVDPDGRGVWIPDGMGGYIAEAGDSASTLATDAGISLKRANELVESQLGSNYIGADGGVKSNVKVGNKVVVPEIKAKAEARYNEWLKEGESNVVSVNPKSQNDGAMIQLMKEINEGGPQALQDFGDATALVGYGLTLTGIGAPIGAPLAAAGNAFSTAGSAWDAGKKLYNGDAKGSVKEGAFIIGGQYFPIRLKKYLVLQI